MMLDSLFSRCKHLVNYSGKSISFGQLKGVPIKIPVEVSGIAIKPELIQTANACVQVLDTLQFGQCQRISKLSKLKPPPTQAIVDLSVEQDKCATLIAYLSIISISSAKSPEVFEKVLANWIASVGAQIPPHGTSVGEKTAYSLNFPFGEPNHKKAKRSVRNNREMFRHLRYRKFESPSLPCSPQVFELAIEAHTKIRNAASEYPYLAEAIEKQRTFDIKENLRMMESN